MSGLGSRFMPPIWYIINAEFDYVVPVDRTQCSGDSVIPYGVNSIASINVKNHKASQGFETSAKIKDTRFT
ncbi:hypothetical protein DAHU10_035140 [Hanseniaspora uvarum]|nr:hypothetical protein DAHU10_035140 [Hanseniaspora uvarum]